MRIKKIVLMAIRGDKNIRKRLKKELKISEPTLYKKLSENSDDLTKAAAMQVYREELGLTDNEILDSEPSTASV